MGFCTNCGNRLSESATICEACGARATSDSSTPPETPNSSASVPDDLKKSSAGEKTGKSTETPPGNDPSAAILGTQVGRVLGGRYQLDQCIGSGGMGEIYRARRLHIGDTVAVKVLRPDVVENEKSRQRFYREARAAAMLHHPNAVVIHDFGEDNDGTAYIVMELLIGRSLRQVLIDDSQINAPRAYGIMRQTCAALDAGHRNGIIHRDIKPDNIVLLDSNDGVDHVKILDFGIAKLRDKALDTASIEQRLTHIGTVIGTPHYMSPEQCQGEEADARSDIYSLGIVLYELLTGVAPFIAKTPTGIAIKHVTEQPRSLRELNPNITLPVEKVVLHALEKDPNARPQTALELAREFEAALGNEPGAARFYQSNEREVTDKPKVNESRKTEVLPKASEAETILQSVSSPPSYETAVAPPPETGQLVSSTTDSIAPAATGEQQPMTSDQPSSSSAQTEIFPPKKQTTDVRKPAATIPNLSPVPTVDQFRTSLTPPTDETKRPRFNDELKAEMTWVTPRSQTSPRSMFADLVASVSRMPRLVGLGLLLSVMIGLMAWWLGSGKPQSETANVMTAVPPSAQTSGQPSPSPTSAYPEVNAPEGMVYVIGGVLRIGRDSGGEENEQPAHVVTIKPFFLDRTEVTNEQYQKFLDAAGYDPPASWRHHHFPDGAEKLPVTDVTWEDAVAYTKWAGKRLPTEEEWEFAARGPEGRLYPWGNEWVDGSANVTIAANDKKQILPVGQFPKGASPFGVLDLSGNVWEWTSSDYREYPGGKISIAPGFSNLKIIRGGSFESTPKYATATLRRGWPATRSDWPKKIKVDYSQTGFRSAQDVKNP